MLDNVLLADCVLHAVRSAQWRSGGCWRPGRTAILLLPKFVICLMPPYHPHFATPSWLSPGAVPRLRSDRLFSQSINLIFYHH